MPRFAIAFASKLVGSLGAAAQTAAPRDLIREVRTAIALNRLSTERVLVGIDHGLDTAGYAMKLTTNAHVIHEEFREIADRLPGVRAIIAIAEDGCNAQEQMAKRAFPGLRGIKWFLAVFRRFS